MAIALLSAVLAPSAGTFAQPISSLAKGRLLVAREGMIDPNFSRTVVLLVSYDESGAMGVVLNRPSHMQLDHLLPHLDLSSRNLDPVFIGGPVATRRATILFSSSEPGLSGLASGSDVLFAPRVRLFLDTFYGELASANAICVGERHGNPHDHWAQREMLATVTSKGGRPASLRSTRTANVPIPRAPATTSDDVRLDRHTPVIDLARQQRQRDGLCLF